MQDAKVDVAASPAKVLAPAVLAPRSPTHGVAAPAGVGSSSVVHVDNRNTVNQITNNRTSNNSGNTSTNNIVLL